jgi:hypothetical protein
MKSRSLRKTHSTKYACTKDSLSLSHTHTRTHTHTHTHTHGAACSARGGLLCCAPGNAAEQPLHQLQHPAIYNTAATQLQRHHTCSTAAGAKKKKRAHLRVFRLVAHCCQRIVGVPMCAHTITVLPLCCGYDVPACIAPCSEVNSAYEVHSPMHSPMRMRCIVRMCVCHTMRTVRMPYYAYEVNSAYVRTLLASKEMLHTHCAPHTHSVAYALFA